MTTDLPTPTSGDDLHEEALERLWAGIGARRRARARVRQRTRLAGAGLGAALVAVALFGRPAGNDVASSRAVPAATPSPTGGALHLDTGSALAESASLSAPERTMHFTLDDGSTLELARGARLEVRANTASAFTARLTGSATFEVTPGGPRRWSIVADLVTVDVIGTRFDVRELDGRESNGEPAERVVVEHGIVLVRGEGVPGHLERLVDGQSVTVTSPRTEASAARHEGAPARMSTASQGAAAPSSRWEELARGGNYAEAYDQLGAEGLRRETDTASVDDLFQLADVARLSAHGEDAVPPLTRILEEHRHDARAPVAAFTLGKLQLDRLGAPNRAARAFEQALSLGLPDGLVEDAYARLVEADMKAGDVEGARRVRRQYGEKYPAGGRSPTMDRWIASAPAAPGEPR